MLGLTIVAAALALYGAFQSRLRSTVLSGPLLFLALGLVLSPSALGIVDLSVDTTTVQILLKSTLVILLFTEASHMDVTAVRREAPITARLLGFGMPLAILFGAILAATAFGVLSVWEAAVLGALLAPTDAALGQPVVSNPRVPAVIRRSLSVESGLNDGLAVPIAFAFAAAGQVSAQETSFDDALWFLVQQIVLAVIVGFAVGWIGGRGLVIASRRGWTSSAWLQLSFVALAGVAFAGTEYIGGNGFIAAWVSGLTFAVAAVGDLEVSAFGERAADLLTMLSFVMFGAALLPSALERAEVSWAVYAVLSLALVRPLAVAISMFRSRLRFPTVAYLGWFGPRGIASLILAVLVLQQFDLPNIGLLLDIVAVTVALSAVAHGATAWAGSEAYGAWIERVGLGPLRKYERTEPREGLDARGSSPSADGQQEGRQQDRHQRP